VGEGDHLCYTVFKDKEKVMKESYNGS